ncbi:MAG: outer membrane protein [Phenylobacterium sp.]|jgi:outer membrane protein
MNKILAASAALLLANLTITPQAMAAEKAEKAEKKSEFIFGIGLLAASIPHYAGAEESTNVVTPFPYFYYKSDDLTIDRNAFAKDLWRTESLELTLTGAGSIGVDSDDNEARTDMPDLGWVGAIGPTLNWYAKKDQSVFVQFATRKAFAFDSGLDSIGWQAETSVNWRSKPIGESWGKSWAGKGTMRLSLKAQLSFADSKYNDYLYGVDTAYATTGRAAYNASGGYSGAQLSMGLSFKSDDYWAGAFTRYNNVSGVTFDDSPLVINEHNLSFGLAFAWLL